MATLRNKQKLAATNKENCEEHPGSNLAQNTKVPRSQEDYTSQVSEKIEGRVTKKLFKKFSRTESRVFGALSHLDEFHLNKLIQGHSGSAPEMSRNTLDTNQGMTTTSRVILILKRASLRLRLHKTLAQKMVTTVCIVRSDRNI